MKRIRTILIVLSLIVSYQGIFSSPDAVPSFKNIPKAKFSGKLKSVAYASVRSTLLKDYKDTEQKEIRYVPCSDDFPKLIGDFPCSLLSWDGDIIEANETNASADAASVEGESSEEHDLGGKVSVQISKTKSPNQNGKVLLLGEGEDMLRLFYFPNGNISHYQFRDEVIVFRWASEKETQTLVGIFHLKLNSELFPISGKELSFTP
ncbi:LIC_11883 family protein [Leptospira idonii]|uniref:Uncharacterized protein n=1 Tax=Leptospira idonii TaxID=1193500 RepID=A0A4R9LVE7_9LEPT|nr:hypothetical protein [Leptospira idonii]TGN18160.1 hypothetical protein EHS15_12145 [Leptospira idonii]